VTTTKLKMEEQSTL